MKKLILRFLFGLKRKKSNDDFTDALDAYLLTTYSEICTKEELKERIIERLKREIKIDYKTYHNYVNISTYSKFNEKQILPEVAEYFKSKNYKVDLHNDEDYKDVNVLIINWQNLEKVQ